MSRHAIKNKNSREDTVYVGNFDYTTLFTVILLVLFGIVMIFSASSYVASTRSEYNFDMFMFLKKQTFAVSLGFVAMFFMANFNYRKLQKIALPLYLISNGLLIFVFLFDLN